MKRLLVLLAATWAATAFAQAQGAAAVPPAVTQASPTPASQPVPSSRWTAAQIREAFQLADVNADGQLSRAEAQRLTIMPRSFEDADLNQDGALTLPEYQASFAAQ